MLALRILVVCQVSIFVIRTNLYIQTATSPHLEKSQHVVKGCWDFRMNTWAGYLEGRKQWKRQAARLIHRAKEKMYIEFWWGNV